MKKNIYLCISLLIFLLFSCTSSRQITLTDRQVKIENRSGHQCGYGVLLGQGHLWSASHVVYPHAQLDPCDRIRIGKDIFPIAQKYPALSEDSIEISFVSGLPDMSPPPIAHVAPGFPIFLSVEQSGSIIKISGKITAVDTSYTGYDATLQNMQTYTGAIETDIVV